LATGLKGPHERSGGLWIGWAGETTSLDDASKATLAGELERLRAVPVELSEEDVLRFYEGFSNQTIWPLFHYLLDHVRLEEGDWASYRAVNERFADAVVKRYEEGDQIWVQDYQLTLLPNLLRERLPNAAIGFFLHIPFPASEVFRILPWRKEVLRGLLGADLVGFHATSYLEHFASSALRLLGQRTVVDRIDVGDREVRLGVFPMGVDARRISEAASAPPSLSRVHDIAEEAKEQRLILAVDRLDYTKGIRLRLRAIEQLFERHPDLRGRLRFVQVAVPSRTGIDAYEDFRRSVDELVGRINGRFGTTSWMPVHYLYRSLDETELFALYRAADLALVTPLRDGMNLVAKEFVAAREDGDGVLILSEFAGASEELDGACLVNPYDVEGLTATIKAALDLSPQERRLRMERLRARVMTHDVHRWAASFLTALEEAHERTSPRSVAYSTSTEIDKLVEEARRADALRILLDYDGTLVPFADTPDAAAPDSEVRDLLAALSARPKTKVCVISGRSRLSLDAWLGRSPVALAAEHGFWTRFDAAAQWQADARVSTAWKKDVEPIMQAFAERTPGAAVESKGGSLAWHYRRARPEFGVRQANELQNYLSTVLTNLPVEILRLEKVVEVRTIGIDKGRVARAWLEHVGGGTALALGDDGTDEDMFNALDDSDLTVHVGPRPSVARFRVNGPAAVRRLLWSIAR
jgi:trehalose 6-phosphate synthase/phosphatase